MSEPFAALRAARTVLEDALGLFDGAALDDASVPTAFARATTALAALEDPAALRESVAENDLERFDDELEDLIRLNAILISSASRDRDRLVGRLKSVRESRRDLSYYGEGLDSGERCDIAG